MKTRQCAAKGCMFYQWTRLRKGRKVHICTSPNIEPNTVYARIIYELDKCPEK
mgnify:CR=1 FL=1